MKQTYIICTVQRSGSTVLCDMLHRTRRAGYPAEYFDPEPHAAQYWQDKVICGGEDDFLDKAIKSGTTANGVFAIKLHRNHINLFRQRLLDSLKRSGTSVVDNMPLDELIAKKFGNVKYVWLRRKNKIAQAISHYKAASTGIWSEEAKSEERVLLDRNLGFAFSPIHQRVQLVSEQDQQWAQFFQTRQIRPLMLVYEDFLENPALTLKSLFQYLELPTDDLDCSLPKREKQSDGRSKEWEKTYREMQIQRLRNALAEMETAEIAEADSEGVNLLPPQEKISALRPRTGGVTTDETGRPTLTAYFIRPEDRMTIVPASAKREWMEQTANRFAYRCLPLILANQAGWVLLNRHKVEITWDGRNAQDAIRIVMADGSKPHAVQSHFGHGIVTFLIPYIFRTSEGYNLLMRGPANSPKDSIAPLEGIVETDWLEASSTMNWRFTRPNVPVVFEKDEPIAMIVPSLRGELESFLPCIRAISADPILQEGYAKWAQSRGQFNLDLRVPDSAAKQQGWQRHYMHGMSVDKRVAREHQTKLSINKFVMVGNEGEI